MYCITTNTIITSISSSIFKKRIFGTSTCVYAILLKAHFNTISINYSLLIEQRTTISVQKLYLPYMNINSISIISLSRAIAFCEFVGAIWLNIIVRNWFDSVQIFEISFNQFQVRLYVLSHTSDKIIFCWCHLYMYYKRNLVRKQEK